MLQKYTSLEGLFHNCLAAHDSAGIIKQHRHYMGQIIIQQVDISNLIKKKRKRV